MTELKGAKRLAAIYGRARQRHTAKNEVSKGAEDWWAHAEGWHDQELAGANAVIADLLSPEAVERAAGILLERDARMLVDPERKAHFLRRRRATGMNAYRKGVRRLLTAALGLTADEAREIGGGS